MGIKRIVIVVWVLTVAAFLPSRARCAEYASSGESSVRGKVEVSAPLRGEHRRIELRVSGAEEGDSAKGWLRLWSADGSRETKVDLVYLRVDGEYAWLAGECKEDTDGLQGRWVFLAVHDGGKPGRLVDHIWLEWLGEGAEGRAEAKSKVENLDTPAESKSIESGDIEVKE